MKKFLKILIGISIIIIFGIISWWIVSTQFNKFKCFDNADCVNTCCGCISVKEKCDIECEVLPVRVCECIDGNCVQAESITEEQAIAIANGTEETQEFLKLYPDANTYTYFFEKCLTDEGPGECPPPHWTIKYYLGEEWYKEIGINIKIDAKTGEIIEKYPKLEYVKNRDYCESDGDCTIHIHGCVCSNFIWKNYVEPGIAEEVCNPEGLTCKCIDNTCLVEK